jgi:hypothetical protein
MKFKLKAPGSKRLNVGHEKLLSNFAFNCDLRHYNKDPQDIRDTFIFASGDKCRAYHPHVHGRAVQVDPIKPSLKARMVSTLETKM